MDARTGELRFEGRVVIVTGAGANPGMGRSHARLFAERGASVVVNDLGVGMDGRGRVKSNAEAVAEEIRREGGSAVADVNSVAERDSAAAVVQTALDAFGRVDVLVNNAGIVNHAPFDVLSDGDAQRAVDVHLMGSIWMTRAAWPHMNANGYGRIVNITSGSMFGHSHVSIYGAAKAGAFGLARNLAVEGQPHDIKVNCVSPSAGGVSVTLFNDRDTEFVRMMQEKNRPEYVSPTVALLSHESCPCSGKVLNVYGGHVEEVFFGRTQGYHKPGMTLEDVAANWDQVTDRTDAVWFEDAEDYAIPPWVTIPYVPS
jgi:NAD(P)-dependent dehydrogenase (short-subunit alcohol dehydrogenase family)